MWVDDVAEADLRRAVATSTSWRSLLRHFEKTSPRAGRLLRQRCDVAGISYVHFVGGGGRAVAPDLLRDAVQNGTSWPEVMHTLGISADSGSARASLRRRATALGVDVRHLGRPAAPEQPAFRGSTSAAHLRRAAPLLVAARCALLGHDVSWPLEPRPYDLLIDTAQEGLLRVQVKSGTRFTGGSWIVWITKTAGGRRCAYTSAEIDYFGVVTGDHDVYMLPVGLVEGQTSLSLRRYEQYRLA